VCGRVCESFCLDVCDNVIETAVWLVRSIKLYVSFAKEPYKRDDILQKRSKFLSILLTVCVSAVVQGGEDS